MIQHHINTENAKPVKQAPQRLPFHHLKEVKKLVESMLDNNVIEPSNGPWVANNVGEEERWFDQILC